MCLTNSRDCHTYLVTLRLPRQFQRLYQSVKLHGTQELKTVSTQRESSYRQEYAYGENLKFKRLFTNLKNEPDRHMLHLPVKCCLGKSGLIHRR